MLDNKQLAVTAARYMFHSMKPFPTSWAAQVGSLKAHLSEGATAAWILVTDNGSPCYSIETSGNRVEVSNGNETRNFNINGLTGVPAVARNIRKFFGMC